jgi:hypothetical protein
MQQIKFWICTNSSSYGGRFINKTGKANVEKEGMHIFIVSVGIIL